MDLHQELDAARVQTDALFAAIDPAALYDRPIPERHRMIFYLGHLEAFDWNQISQTEFSAPSFHPTFDKLFAFGIDPEPGQLPSDKPSDWPSLDEIAEYKAKVREFVDGCLSDIPEEIGHMMIEHRHMHAETFAYILHNLDYAKKFGPAPALSPCEPVRHEMVEIPAGTASLGQQEGFGWDNEFSAHDVPVPAFAIGKYKVSNGEYLEFVKDGGTVPHYWARRDGKWYWRGMFGEVPLPLDWPVYATLEQARAYAAYKSCAVPTEAEYHRACPAGIERDANCDYRYWDPTPIRPSRGISQMIGNGWEWTDTVFAPFEGFSPRATYPGYSADFFDGKHFVMKGASPRTAAKLIRPSLRNWFRPEYPYVYGTFRLCQR
jgi:hypothetical protein